MTDELKYDLAVECLIRNREAAIKNEVRRDRLAKVGEDWVDAVMIAADHRIAPYLMQWVGGKWRNGRKGRETTGIYRIDRDFDLESLYQPRETIAENADGSLKCRFVRTGADVTFEVLDQDEQFRCRSRCDQSIPLTARSFPVRSYRQPEMSDHSLYVRGALPQYDHVPFAKTFDSVQAANDYIEKATESVRSVKPVTKNERGMPYCLHAMNENESMAIWEAIQNRDAEYWNDTESRWMDKTHHTDYGAWREADRNLRWRIKPSRANEYTTAGIQQPFGIDPTKPFNEQTEAAKIVLRFVRTNRHVEKAADSGWTCSCVASAGSMNATRYRIAPEHVDKYADLCVAVPIQTTDLGWHVVAWKIGPVLVAEDTTIAHASSHELFVAYVDDDMNRCDIADATHVVFRVTEETIARYDEPRLVLKGEIE